MRLVLIAEELALMALGLYAFNELDVNWAWFFAFILLPDIGMIGYILNPVVGAITYNLFHHRLIAIAVYALGFYLDNFELLFTGTILFTHIAMDRVFGYGLKYPDKFKHTHLDTIR